MKQTPKETTVISHPPPARVSIDPLLLRQLLRQSYTSTSTPALDAQELQELAPQDPSLSDDEDTIADAVTKRVMDMIAPAIDPAEATEAKVDWFVFPLRSTTGNLPVDWSLINALGQTQNLIDPTLGITNSLRVGIKVFVKHLHVKVLFKLGSDTVESHAIRFQIYRDKANTIAVYRDLSAPWNAPVYGRSLMDPAFQPDATGTSGGHIGSTTALIAPKEWDMVNQRETYVDEIIVLNPTYNRMEHRSYSIKIDKEVNFTNSGSDSADQIISNALKYAIASDIWSSPSDQTLYTIVSACIYTDA